MEVFTGYARGVAFTNSSVAPAPSCSSAFCDESRSILKLVINNNFDEARKLKLGEKTMVAIQN
jgi:hypothetical protein